MTLNETWFMDGYIDFEFQKYRLLAYLQEVDQQFNETRLYPPLSDVVFHYNNLTAFRDNKKLLQDQFPKRMGSIDLQKLEVTYEKMLEDTALMQELERITQYALDEMKGTIEHGTEIYDLVEKQLRIEPIGIMPLYKNEGYILLRYGNLSEVRAYAYVTTIFEHMSAKYRGIRISYIDSWQRNIINTYEQIKRDIIRSVRTLPNPAVYSIEFPLQIPLDETLLPIAKRMLVRYIEHEK